MLAIREQGRSRLSNWPGPTPAAPTGSGVLRGLHESHAGIDVRNLSDLHLVLTSFLFALATNATRQTRMLRKI